MEKLKQMIKRFDNKKLRLALIISGVIILLLLTILTVIIVNNSRNKEINENPGEQNQQEEEKKTMILDIPSMSEKDAFEILDILIEKYGEPNPQGLVEVLKEFRDTDAVSFQTVNWIDIRDGYNFTFNFWTDGTLAREDSYYIIGYKSKGHNLEEILELTNLERDSEEFVYNITDLGGAVFNIGITPKEAALKKEPNVEEDPEELTREEILELLKENANIKWKNDAARAKLEFDNQTKAYDWVMQQTQYPDLMENAKKMWKLDYTMVKWEYEKLVKAYEATIIVK